MANEWVRIRRTDSGDEGETTMVTRTSFDRVWSGKGYEEAPEPTSDTTLESKTVEELRGMLDEQGKPTTGRKAELIERLQAPAVPSDEES